LIYFLGSSPIVEKAMLVTFLVTILLCGSATNLAESIASADIKDSLQDFEMAPASAASSYSSASNGKGQLFGEIQVPVITRHKIKLRPANSQLLNQPPPVLVVEANPVPLKIVLKSESSDFIIKHLHKSKAGNQKETFSVDEPWIRRHFVRRPIVHNVHEVIIPVRNVVQEVKPLQENIKSIFAGRVVSTVAPEPPIPPEETSTESTQESFGSIGSLFDF